MLNEVVFLKTFQEIMTRCSYINSTRETEEEISDKVLAFKKSMVNQDTKVIGKNSFS